MPFELGLAVALDALREKERWYVCETLNRRVNKSLSDLDGTAVHIHEGTVRGLLAVNVLLYAFIGLLTWPLLRVVLRRLQSES